MESQFSEARVDELRRELGDSVTGTQNRLQQQHVELMHRTDDSSSQLDQANMAKAMLLTRQLEEAKQAVDDNISVRNKVIIT